MKQKYLQNSITTLLVVSFILMPLSAIPKKAEAQGIAAYTSGLVPAIAQLPLCRGKLTGATKYLFGQSSAARADAAKLIANEGTKKAEEEILKRINAEAQSQFDKIGVYDAEANKKLNELQTQLAFVRASTDSLDVNDGCLKNIGRLVIKMLLQKITLSTVNWINSGFDGKPSFIQDPGKFFNDIAKNEILQFGLEINNPELFPFGKIWLRNQAEQFNNKFADNARYSLDELIRKTTPEFSANAFALNFSQGGWNAWSAMTQYPGNNPLGFQLMADSELQRRLEGTSQSAAQNVRDALQAANGFLGDQRCVQPKGLTRQQDEEGLIARNNGDITAPICERWEYVTPGKLIAEAATSTIKYPENNLLKADDLNDAVAAILDALLSRFSSDIMQKGYANFDTNDGADGTFVYNQDALRTDYSSQTEKDFTTVNLTSSWFTSNPNFNIRTDLTQALIDEQRTYSDKLALQNKELNSTTDGKDYAMSTNGVSNAYGLVPTITQLDYCIPGPHPGWEEDSRGVLDAVTGVIIPETAESVKNKSKEQLAGAAKTVTSMGAIAAGAYIGSGIGSLVPVVGTAIGAVVGAAAGAVINFVAGWIFGPDNEKIVRGYYANIILGLTGIVSDYENGDNKNANNISSKQGAVQSLNVMLERYIDIAHLVYNKKVLPSVYREAASEFNKLKGYGQMISNNEETISNIKNVIKTLNEIKGSVDSLNQKRNNGLITDEVYENDLKPQINAFGRLSANMVNGDDIASADNLLKQIRDEQKYVYKDLLKGPFGCEKELEENTQNLPAQLYATTRAEYPFPILYKYNMTAGVNIPDPFPSISGLTIPNKTNISATNTLGPGFLSFYKFQERGNEITKCIANENGEVPLCELLLDDILPMNPNVNKRSLGITSDNGTIKIKLPTGGTVSITVPTSGPFENTIGVY